MSKRKYTKRTLSDLKKINLESLKARARKHRHGEAIAGVTIERARDFDETGLYDVCVGGKVFRIYRNRDASTAGAKVGEWFLDSRHLPKKDFYENLLLERLGDTQSEALIRLKEIAHKLVKPIRTC